MLTTCADSPTQCVETHTKVTDLTSTKQSAEASFTTARADIAHTKVRHADLKVDSAVQSTYLQREVTSLSPLKQNDRWRHIEYQIKANKLSLELRLK